MFWFGLVVNLFFGKEFFYGCVKKNYEFGCVLIWKFYIIYYICFFVYDVVRGFIVIV